MINRIVWGQPPINAQEAMELTGRYSVAEIKQKNFSDNVRARAKRVYGDMCKLNQALRLWEEVFPRKRSRLNSPVPPVGASSTENRCRSRSNSQELPERLNAPKRQRLLSVDAATAGALQQARGRSHSQSSQKEGKRSQSVSPKPPANLKMPADKGFRLTPKQIVKHAGKLNKRKEKKAKAVAQVTLRYEEEKNKEKGMTSEQVALEIQEKMGEWVAPSTIWRMVGQGCAGEAPKRRGPEGKVTDE
jgi:hypothetical protein